MTTALAHRHPKTAAPLVLAFAFAFGLPGAVAPGPARAEKADRQQPLNIEADQSSTVDMARRVVVFNGRVVLSQGSLRILADRVEVSEVGEGHRTALARGRPEQPAHFREKREGVDEFVEGQADLIEYDSRESLIRLTGKAVVRRLRGTQLADEVQGETIVWNGNRETFSVSPAERSGPEGRRDRVRGVFIPPPPPQSPTASPPAAASTAAPRR
jgi:lipopolysaccharide export system protein LptA